MVTLALASSALASFADLHRLHAHRIPTDPAVVLDVFLGDGIIAFVLILLVAVEAFKLVAAYRAKQAGARLHAYIVVLFTITAAVPSVIMAVVGAVALDRGLYPGLRRRRGPLHRRDARCGKLIRSKQCESLQRDADLAASDLERARVGYSDRNFFQNFFNSRVHALGFTTAVIMGPDGRVTERVDTDKPGQVQKSRVRPISTARARASRYASGSTAAAASSPCATCRATTAAFLYVERPLDPFTIAFQQHATEINDLFALFDSHRRAIQSAFIVMYGLLAAIMLLSAIWLGLSFANALVAPIRRLINATDQVSSGNLYVQVPVRRSEGDLARLGETFNKMISELRLQQNRLIAARETIDERRLFTEAVLSGVPAAVIGIDGRGDVTVVNPSARKLLDTSASESPAVGTALSTLIPELAAILGEAREGRQRLQQGQVTLSRVPAASGPSTSASRATSRRGPTGTMWSRSTTSPTSSLRSGPRPGPTWRAASPTRSRIR